MSAKPATPGLWGTDPGANLVEPGATLRALGWPLGERPLDGHLNKVLHEHGEIAQYVHDGVFTPSIKAPAYLTDTVTPLVIPGAAFRHIGTPGGTVQQTYYWWYQYTEIVAMVPLVEGQRVTALEARVERVGAVAASQLQLIPFSDGALDVGGSPPGTPAPVATVTIPAGGTGGTESVVVTGINYKIPAKGGLLLRATQPASNAIALLRAVVYWDRPVI